MSGTCFISSMSRNTRGDLDRIEPGVRVSISACQMPGISLYLLSTHW